MNEWAKKVIEEYLEVKETYDKKKKAYDKLMKGDIKDWMIEKKLKKLSFDDEHVIIYTPPRDYPSLKKDFTMDAVYLELPHMFEIKSGYESIKLMKKKYLREEN